MINPFPSKCLFGLWASGLCLVLGLGLAGQAPAGSGFIERFDADRDGRVSRAEFQGSENLFSRLDKDGDGHISRAEQPRELRSGQSRNGRTKAAGRPGPNNRTGRPDPIRDFDRDGDGRLSRAEFPGPANHFTRFDADGDGYLGSKEMPGPPPEGGRRNPIRDFDRDNDGRLSKTEFPGPAARFTCFDTNGDGYLTQDEMPGPPLNRNRTSAAQTGQ